MSIASKPYLATFYLTEAKEKSSAQGTQISFIFSLHTVFEAAIQLSIVQQFRHLLG